MRTSYLFVLAPILCAVSMAQESRGTITGTVSDPQGAAIPGAAVVARNLGTNLEAKTTSNESGVYVLPFLNTGTYTVTATVAGFKSAGVLHLNPQESITDRPYDNGGMDYLSIAGGTPVHQRIPA